MPDFIKRFVNFDKLIATTLIKILYWIGLALILIGVVVGMLGGLAGMTQDFVAGLGAFVGAPIAGVIGLLFWRFVMEVYIVIFSIHDRLGEIRDKIGGPTP
ncbi:hypothetical protein GCM10011367_06350 [Marinicauda pacifica]|uniref:DUF4282 domain-containing protein n=1 Tax=Marinicauda pacifica TaxID=1133559 RepID=A0A4S2HER8_9PROT|nr:DUF4282 domain-containing protein [Marinicauda pacifica]TGY94298.1 DUF4282 domain-containing protein [Marinicauda pacifica]GGE34714.1 hypothetical protein GCM10011367_06350 [Marinicauda pacifica]